MISKKYKLEYWSVFKKKIMGIFWWTKSDKLFIIWTKIMFLKKHLNMEVHLKK